MPARALAAVTAALAAHAAAAGVWAARDLGTTRAEAHCVAAGLRAFEDHALAFGGGPVATEGWTVSAENVERRGYDAILLCAAGGAGRTRATLVLHGGRDDIGRTVAANRLADRWRTEAAALDAQFLSDLGLQRWEW